MIGDIAGITAGTVVSGAESRHEHHRTNAGSPLKLPDVRPQSGRASQTNQIRAGASRLVDAVSPAATINRKGGKRNAAMHALWPDARRLRWKIVPWPTSPLQSESREIRRRFCIAAHSFARAPSPPAQMRHPADRIGRPDFPDATVGSSASFYFQWQSKHYLTVRAFETPARVLLLNMQMARGEFKCQNAPPNV